MDEDNFPSLANSPTPSPRAFTNGPAQSNNTSAAEGAEEGNPAAASKDPPTLKGPPTRVASAWGAVEGLAHKATTPEKKSKAVGKADPMSSQQKAQAANSKLQPGAASFKAKNKSTGSGKIPWVETGMAVELAALRGRDGRVRAETDALPVPGALTSGTASCLASPPL